MKMSYVRGEEERMKRQKNGEGLVRATGEKKEERRRKKEKEKKEQEACGSKEKNGEEERKEKEMDRVRTRGTT